MSRVEEYRRLTKERDQARRDYDWAMDSGTMKDKKKARSAYQDVCSSIHHFLHGWKDDLESTPLSPAKENAPCDKET